MPSYNNTMYFTVFQRIGKVLGLVPFGSNLNIIYPMILIVGITCWTIYSISGRFLVYHFVAPTMVILDILNITFEYIFVVSALGYNVWYRKQWKIFLASFVNHQFGSCKIVVTYIKLVLLAISYFCVHIIGFYAWSNTFYVNYFQYYHIYFFSNFYEFFLILLIITVLKTIKLRYQYLNDAVENEFRKTTGENVLTKMVEIEHKLQSYAELINIFNNIFGWPVFCFFISTLINCLHFLNTMFGLLAGYYGNTSAMTFINVFVFTFFYNVSTIKIKFFKHDLIYTNIFQLSVIVVISLCDGIRQILEKLKQICYTYQGHYLKFPMIRSEIFILANCAKFCKPRFSAAGFFFINKGTLITMIGATASYVIIIIQFNTTKLTIHHIQSNTTI